MAFTLYQRLDASEISTSNKEVKRLAAITGRSENSVKLKLWNLSSFDPYRVAQGKRGMGHASKKDRAIWDRYLQEGDALVARGIELLNRNYHERQLLGPNASFLDIELPEGGNVLVLATQRVHQNFFRKSLLENYRHRCCVTGIDNDTLLIASHIKPWADSDPFEERTSPANGLLLNALHDKAFDKGLMTIDQDYHIHVSHKVKDHGALHDWLWAYDGRRIALPENARWRPRRDFIEYHNDVIWQG